MSPFPNQILNDNSRTLKPEYFQSVDDFVVPGTTNKNLQYFPQSPTMDSSSSTRTLSDDSSEVIDQGQYSDLNTHQWEEGGVSVFDGIELPVITDANLYIKNIDYDISDETLYSVFSQLGEITSHHIIRDATKRSRGFGFMSYKTTEQAKRAIVELNGRFIGKKPIVVMLHIKKEQRRMHKQTMKDAIGPPQQLGHPNGSNYQYHQQQPQQPGGGYANQPHDQSYGNSNQNGESYGGNMRPNSDQRNHRRPGFERDPSFNRPVIGAEYEPSHLHSPPMTPLQDMEYLNQVRKHQQELQTQESIREEYRMRNRQAERRMPLQTQGSFQCLSPRSPQLQSPSLHSPQLHSPQLHSPRLHSPRMHSPGSFGRLMPGPQPQVGSQGPGLSQAQSFHQGPQDTRPRPPQQIGIPGQMQRGREYEFSHHPVRPPSVSGFPSLNSSMSQERGSTHLPLMLDPELEQSMRLLSVQNNEIHHQNSNGSQSLRLVFPPHSQSESRRGSMHSQSGLDMHRHLCPEASRDSSPGRLSVESSTHGFASSDDYGRPRSLEGSSHGFSGGSDELYTRSRVGSLDGLGLNLGQLSPTLPDGFGSFFPSALGAVGSSTPSRGQGAHTHGGSSLSLVSTHSHSIQSTVNSTRSSSVSNEEDCRGGSMSDRDRAFSNVASLALNDFSDLTNPDDQKKLIADQLFPLVEVFKPFLARSITDYLVNNAAAAELLEVLVTPDLLLPHYIAVALSMMTMASSEKSN